MRRRLRWLDRHFEGALLCLFLVLIVLVSTLQIVARIARVTLSWTDEFCRLCWISSVFLSLPFCLREGSMLRVDVLLSRLPARARRIADGASLSLEAALMAVMCIGSARIVARELARERHVVTSAMALPMWALYCVMTLGFGLAAFRCAQRLILLWREGRSC